MANILILLGVLSICLLVQEGRSLPTMRMRLCVASNNPYRLQNQCVYCHNKKFRDTVRTCTGTPYLPANVSLEEGYCMVRQCRAQMPLYRPEPFIAPGTSPELGDAIGVNVDAITHQPPATGDDLNYNNPTAPFMQLVTKPLRRRPPAQIFVGQPLRPISPFRPSFLNWGRKDNELDMLPY